MSVVPRRDDASAHFAEEGSDKRGLPERHDSKTENNNSNNNNTAQLIPEAGEAVSRNQRAVAHNALRSTIDTAIGHLPLVHRTPHPHQSPASAALHLQIDLDNSSHGIVRVPTLRDTPTIYETPVSEHPLDRNVRSPAHIPGMGSSLTSNLSTSSMASSLSPGSTLPSPYLAAMADITPLPSPLVGGDSPGPWPKARHGTTTSSRHGYIDQATPTTRSASLPTSPESPTKRKKGYGSLMPKAAEAFVANAQAAQDNKETSKHHTPQRSISDFVPEALHNTRQRHVTFGPGGAASLEAAEYRMHREEYLAKQRGLTAPADVDNVLPTPPPSNTSVAESDEADEEQPALSEDDPKVEYLQIHCGIHKKRRKFRQIRQLGQGTFSKVMLATNERLPASLPPDIEHELDPHKLVAVKIVEHGPTGGTDEERIETSLKREVEMLKSVSHPSLVHLKACEYQETRALLVLTYCPGGDLFELASGKSELLTPSLIQRIFSELVSAVRYLHQHWIVHRDIKLENVLVNIPSPQLRDCDPVHHPTPIVTLTDLGLSRRIPDPPESPLLTTRCGSEDYAAPEILLGQPYDGRLTDAWALGVLLYALMEGRLPFDAPPGKPDRSRNTHRIARCDWIWCRFGDEEGEWDPQRGAELSDGQLCVESLLKKVRMGRKPLEEVEKFDWVQQGVQVPGGLQMREEDLDDDIVS